MPKRLALFTSIILFALAAWLIVLLTANMYATGAQAYIQGWQDEKAKPVAEELDDAFAKIDTALNVDPNNTDYLAARAELTRYKSISADPRSPEYEQLNRHALEQYRYLTTLRPAWAPYWSSIAAIKFALWEYDAEMVRAIQNTARLGPWFRSSQFIIMKAGFAGWPFIDEETRLAVNETLDRAMQLQPEETIRYAIINNFDDRLLKYVENDKSLFDYYKNELKKMKDKRSKTKG
jgi:hypothetical protein